MKQHTPPHPFDTFTGNKTPELAIFFNLAHDNIEKFIAGIDTHLQGAPLSSMIGQLSEEAFARLREYIWKGGRFNKNDEGNRTNETQKTLIRELLKKLNGLRNFQSHYWHDSAPLKLSDVLADFINHQHNIAFATLIADNSRNSMLYDEQRKKFPFIKRAENEKFLTLEGRVFLLSFFLTTGEMELLLSQTKGSKQNNTPETKFKRELYTYFCHREGSSWENVGVKNEELETVNVAEQDRILKGRQAYKILNYLNDSPGTESNEGALMFEADGKPVFANTIDTLFQFIKMRGLFGKINFYQLETKQTDEKENKSNKELNEETKFSEQKKRESWAGFKYGERPHRFEISFKTLLQITEDCLLNKKMEYKEAEGNVVQHSAEEHFYKVLDDYITIREQFYYGLKKQGDELLNPVNFKLKKKFVSVFVDYINKLSDKTETVYYTPDQLRNLPLLTTPKAEKKLIQWHDSFIRGKKNEVTRRKSLLNVIRPENEPFDKTNYEGLQKDGTPKVLPDDIRPEPMIFRLAQYYKEQPQKNRGNDRFVEWAAKFLYDFELVPGWYWEMEKLVYEKKWDNQVGTETLKKELLYEQKPPRNFRVRIIDQSVVLGFPRKQNPAGSKDFYKLRLDERALKTLFASHFMNVDNSKTIAGFLNAVKEDYLQLIKGNKAILQLMEEFAIPAYLGGDKKNNASTLKDQLTKFLESKIAWAKKLLENKQKLNRNAKNEAIIEAYKFFDFSKTEGSKFLRKNEYQQMSIVHFMMMQDKDEAGKIFEKFKLEKRLPESIIDLLNQSKDMNHLFELVLNNRIKYFKSLLEGLSEFNDNDNALRVFVSSLGLKLSVELLKPNEKEERKLKSQKHKEDIPFIIHPMLVLKYYYPLEFKAGNFDPNDKTKPHRNIFKELREANPGNMLVKDFYDTAITNILIPGTIVNKLAGDDAKNIKQLVKKINGEKTDHHTKDILLWKIASLYLQAYDVTLWQTFTSLAANAPVKANELFATAILVPLKKADVNFKNLSYTQQEIGQMPDTIYLQLLMHQVDDYFFRTQQGRLYQLALHFINRRSEELELYKEHTDITDKISKWPDGSMAMPVKMGDLVHERKVNAGFAKELLQYIMDWEKDTINSYCLANLPGGDQLDSLAGKNARQAILESMVKKGEPRFIAFYRLNELNSRLPAPLFEKIKILRNQCLHSAIPLTGSYRMQAKPGNQIAELLHIHNMLGKDRTEQSPYALQAEMG